MDHRFPDNDNKCILSRDKLHQVPFSWQFKTRGSCVLGNIWVFGNGSIFGWSGLLGLAKK